MRLAQNPVFGGEGVAKIPQLPAALRQTRVTWWGFSARIPSPGQRSQPREQKYLHAANKSTTRSEQKYHMRRTKVPYEANQKSCGLRSATQKFFQLRRKYQSRLSQSDTPPRRHALAQKCSASPVVKSPESSSSPPPPQLLLNDNHVRRRNN